MTTYLDIEKPAADPDLDIDRLLHPSRFYDHPNDVVADRNLSPAEKRAILSSWASDACAVDSAPTLRRAPGASIAVTFDDIMDALKALDDTDPHPPRRPLWRRSRTPRPARGLQSENVSTADE